MDRKPPRRQFLHLAASAAALPALSRIASAVDYPTRPARIIGGYAAGGPTDTTARLIAMWLSQRLGEQFVVENRPGAGGNTGTEAVVNAPPDCYTCSVPSPRPPSTPHSTRTSVSCSTAAPPPWPPSLARLTCWKSLHHFQPV